MFDNTPDGGMNIVNFPFICSNCIWSIYLSVDTIFQSLWFLLGFP